MLDVSVHKGVGLIMSMNIHDELQRVELFGCLTNEQLDHMAEGSHKVSFPSGRHLIHQGETGGDVFFIVSGEASVIKLEEGSSPAGHPIATVGEGTILGEMSALTDYPAAADVVATSDCQVIRIPRAVFLEAVRKNLSSMSKLTTTVVKRFRSMMGGP